MSSDNPTSPSTSLRFWQALLFLLILASALTAFVLIHDLRIFARAEFPENLPVLMMNTEIKTKLEASPSHIWSEEAFLKLFEDNIHTMDIVINFAQHSNSARSLLDFPSMVPMEFEDFHALAPEEVDMLDLFYTKDYLEPIFIPQTLEPLSQEEFEQGFYMETPFAHFFFQRGSLYYIYKLR